MLLSFLANNLMVRPSPPKPPVSTTPTVERRNRVGDLGVYDFDAEFRKRQKRILKDDEDLLLIIMEAAQKIIN